MPPLDPKLPHDVFVRRGVHATFDTKAEKHGSRLAGLLRSGTIVDKYRIEELLGVGGFAAVYRATHMLLDMPVALKHLRPDILARHPSVSAQLLEEARLAARVRHPNVVHIYDVTQTSELCYIVMELIDGETLSEAIDSRQRLPESEVIRIALDVIAGLDAARESGLVHRDVKPANILLGKNGRACIVDLGLARVSASASEASSTRWSMVGTYGYVAPEQVRDPDKVDFRADMYALGVTLFEALRGRGSFVELPPSQLVSILTKMTAKHVDDRPASYTSLLRDLGDALVKLSGRKFRTTL
jgi:eukaryotic-like serine/threonine-protein kinase